MALADLTHKIARHTRSVITWADFIIVLVVEIWGSEQLKASECPYPWHRMSKSKCRAHENNGTQYVLFKSEIFEEHKNPVRAKGNSPNLQ